MDRTAPHRTAPHRTAPHRTAPHRTAEQLHSFTAPATKPTQTIVSTNQLVIVGGKCLVQSLVREVVSAEVRYSQYCLVLFSTVSTV